MRTVELDEDVYQHIARNTAEIGESASSILRRLLGLGGKASATAAPSVQAAPQPRHELADLLALPMFSTSTTAVSRMMKILHEVHKQKGPEEFSKVLAIQGRNRSYFAKSKEEILRSGRSTQPREVFKTGFWVMTNSPTQQKREMVRDVLKLLGYSSEAVKAGAAAIH